jgi:riboflavin-specific deaminase-like protein
MDAPARHVAATANDHSHHPCGESKAEPAFIDDPFAPFRASPVGVPFVVAQLGQSLDGRIATVSGESRYINGMAALDHLHAIRANVDAVLVGIGTVLADDPQLTVRRVAGPSPARVVLDPRGRLPDCRCLADDGVRRIVLRASPAGVPAGVEEIVLPSRDGRIEPAAIIAALVAAGLPRILVEGGAQTISGFIDAGCIDRLHLLVAPLIIGSGTTGLSLAPVAELARARRPPTRVHILPDGDVLFDCDLSTNTRGDHGK